MAVSFVKQGVRNLLLFYEEKVYIKSLAQNLAHSKSSVKSCCFASRIGSTAGLVQ